MPSATLGFARMLPSHAAVPLALFVALAVLGSSLGAAVAGVPGSAPSVNPTQPSPPVVVATLRFDGVDASTAGAGASAIPLDLGSALPVLFVWSAKGGKLGEPGLVAVASERLDLGFLGTVAATSSHLENGVVLASNGSATYTVSFASYRWVVEGLYEVTAALIAPNGTALWSLLFFVHVEAPFHATVTNVSGVAVAAYLVSVLVLGPRRRLTPTAPKSLDGGALPPPGEP
ncbi:MAG: hypothetical protein L3K23_03230 [Thermoplasmata archaeon]|nr:hypothetical protein [Thermoplasmata archaeon]